MSHERGFFLIGAARVRIDVDGVAHQINTDGAAVLQPDDLTKPCGLSQCGACRAKSDASHGDLAEGL